MIRALSPLLLVLAYFNAGTYAQTYCCPEKDNWGYKIYVPGEDNPPCAFTPYSIGGIECNSCAYVSEADGWAGICVYSRSQGDLIYDWDMKGDDPGCPSYAHFSWEGRG